ncbi:MAG: inositol-phosphate phosphatase [Pseudomonadota bacterium]|nr:inositol-phosphate phosphatase [Pseudomonadota bacterium]
MAHSPYLQAAIDAARAGEAVIRRYWQRNVDVALKADRSPVTVADVEAEQAIKGVLQAAFPDHGFYGEETGRSGGEAGYLWLVDPIDGTKSFVRETPFFSTQIALRRGGEFVLGVSNAPLFAELAWAEAGGGAFLNDRPLRVSTIDSLADATLSFGNLKTLAGDRRWAAVGELVRQANRSRGYGDFCHYHLLAAGKLDAVIESDVNILDVAALAVIVEAAGGRVTDLAGGPLTLDSTAILASNGRLHDRLLACLA